MAKSGPIVIIEDDIDDQEMVTEVIREMDITSEIIFFKACDDAWTYLKDTSKQPFIILCDINLPKMSGLEFKKQVDSDSVLRQKSIPFIFFSTAANKAIVAEAFTKMTVQGFFKKSNNLEELRSTLATIMEYWKLCKHPNGDFS